MKKKKIILTLIIVLIVVLLITGSLIFYYYNQEKNMDYKFEDNKLYITLNAKDWIEVPGDFTYTAEHLKEVNGGRYRDGTYQMNNKKIVFYYDVHNDNINYEGIPMDYANYLKSIYMIHLVYSNDKGKTWNDVEIGNNYIPDSVMQINFENKNKGSMKLKGRDGTTIYDHKTDDGGENWELIK